MKEAKKRILVLEDDLNLLEILNDVFNWEGLYPILINKTDDLPALVKRHQPDLILLDLALRGAKNGGMWCRELKANGMFAQIPIIIFSARVVSESDIGSFGCNAFIPKPFDINDLVNKIKIMVTAN